MSEKYVVSKAGELGTLDEGTYFVLRDTDLFGSAALWAYASVLQVGLELDTSYGFMSYEERKGVTLLAALVAEKAEQWQRSAERHIPT